MNVDPIQLELFRNLLEAAAAEMGIALQRTAFSANIKERRDFSCAIFDASGQLLAQAAHIPVHLGSMPASVEAVLSRLGRMKDGDVAIVNDPFAGGNHLPDITIVSPIYFDGQLLGYAANRAHHADVGGTTPGSMTLSRHIDEEGIRIEPTLLTQAVINRILKAVRTPDERLGDLEAQMNANRVGANAMQRIAQSNGIDTLTFYSNALLDYSHSFMKAAIAQIPSGTYSFEDFLDDDGFGSGPIRIQAAIACHNNRVRVDLTKSAEQTTGCVNCPRAVTLSAVYYCFACLLSEQVPLNAGCFRDIEVVTWPGSVLDAQYPAAVVAGNVETSQRIVDVVFGALAQALPARIPAASCGTMNSVALGGGLAAESSRGASPAAKWTYYETIGGGSGASPEGPGASAIHCHMTNTLNTPAEALELQYPLRVLRFERATGTGGAGKYRGGDGIIREIQALAPCEGTLLSDRRIGQPYGLGSGAAGMSGKNLIDGKSIPGKTKFELAAGDVLTVVTPGGGGWGHQR